MHICLVFAGTEDGGMETHVAELAEMLSIRHQISVIAHQVHRKRFQKRIRFLSIDLDRWRFNPKLKRGINALMREIKPDVIHAHGRKAGHIIGSIKNKQKVPTVLSLHNPANASRIAKSFDTVIGVSSSVLTNLRHDNAIVVFNGRG